MPSGFEQEGDIDPDTGKIVGWVPCEPTSPDDRKYYQGLGHLIYSQPAGTPWPTGHTAGTYELVGPKVQGNPHHLADHQLVRHGADILDDVPTAFDELGRWLHQAAGMTLIEDLAGAPLPGFEGVVWHHPDGRMAKIKVRDFPAPTEEIA